MSQSGKSEECVYLLHGWLCSGFGGSLWAILRKKTQFCPSQCTSFITQITWIFIKETIKLIIVFPLQINSAPSLKNVWLVCFINLLLTKLSAFHFVVLDTYIDKAKLNLRGQIITFLPKKWANISLHREIIIEWFVIWCQVMYTSL